VVDTAPAADGNPTGLDYHEAYKVMFPGLQGQVRLQDLQDGHLKTVDRAARVRRAERERVKAEVLNLIRLLDPCEVALGGRDAVIREMTARLKEIR